MVTAGSTVATNYYDTFGRLTETDRKVVVRKSGGTVYMAWRRRRTWYNALNQVDSVQAELTAECTAPCSSPTWTSDTTQVVQVVYLYDALGRDTARVSSSGLRTRYAFDALGRLRMRYPFAESTAVVDSFRYDLAATHAISGPGVARRSATSSTVATAIR